MKDKKRTESSYPRIKPVGDCAVLIECGECISEEVNRRVTGLAARLEEAHLPGLLKTVPAFASLLVYYDPLIVDYHTVCKALENLAAQNQEGKKAGRTVEIPVCYGGEYGEDLPHVARHAGLSEGEVIRLHSGKSYRIYMLGFLPGFPYLGGLDRRLFTPRLPNPRTKIPAGSVGIGGEQTGIYPMESPGGWQLIGRTPLRLFHPEDGGKVPYEAGDFIRFVPVSPKEFAELVKEQKRR